MSRKQPGMTLKRDEFSVDGGVDNDSADVTSTDRSFQIHGLTTRKSRLAIVDSLTGRTTMVKYRRRRAYLGTTIIGTPEGISGRDTAI